MRNSILPIAVLVASGAGLFGQTVGTKVVSSQANRMEPKIAKPGMVAISGVALGKNKIEEVFLTDHLFDMKIRIPPFAKAGRQQLLLLTTGEDQAYLEQPVYVLVEFGEEAAKGETGKLDAKDIVAAGDKIGNYPEKQND